LRRPHRRRRQERERGRREALRRAIEVTDPAERERYGVALEAHIGWRPSGDFHLFGLDITEVGFFAVVGDGHDVRTWVPPATPGLATPGSATGS
jgi:hypothetical protein